MELVSPTTMSTAVKLIIGCGPLSQVSQLSQPEITLPVTAPLECRNVCPNVTSVPTVPTTIHHVNLSSPKIPLHHARYLQAFDPCASTNPCTTLLITGCGPSNSVKDSVWGTLSQHYSCTCGRAKRGRPPTAHRMSARRGRIAGWQPFAPDSRSSSAQSPQIRLVAVLMDHPIGLPGLQYISHLIPDELAY